MVRRQSGHSASGAGWTGIGPPANYDIVQCVAAANRALEERIRAFARQQALATHFDRFPEDRPRLAAVTLRRVAGTDHPAERHPDVIEAVAKWVEGGNRIGCSLVWTTRWIRCCDTWR